MGCDVALLEDGNLDADGGGGLYASPHHGYTLTHDLDEWEIANRDPDPDDPYDFVKFTNGFSYVGIIGDPDYAEDEMDACLADYYAGRLEGDERLSDIEPLDEPGATGEEQGRAWATYSFTYEVEGDSGTAVRYHECRWLGDGVTIVVLQDISTRRYEADTAARESLLEGLSPADEGDVTVEPGNDEDAARGAVLDGLAQSRNDVKDVIGGDEEPDAVGPVAGNTYVSPTYGVAFEWDATVWSVTDEESGGGTDILALSSGLGVATFVATDAFGEDADGCYADLETRTAKEFPDLGISPVDPTLFAPNPDGRYGLYAATDQGEEIVITLACLPLDGRGATLGVRLIGPLAGVDGFLYLFDILATLR